MKWFTLEETPYHNNEWTIRPSNKFYENISGIHGSYLVYTARWCGMKNGVWSRY